MVLTRFKNLALMFLAVSLPLTLKSLASTGAANCDELIRLVAPKIWTPGKGAGTSVDHTMNVHELYARLERSNSLDLEEIKIENIRFLCASYPGCFVIVQAERGIENKAKVKLLLRDVMGQKFHVDAIQNGTSYVLDLKKRVPIIEQEFNWDKGIEMLRVRFYEDREFVNLSSQEIGKKLTDIQLYDSQSLSSAQEKDVFKKSMVEANTMLADARTLNRELTADDLNRINYLSNQGAHVYRSPKYDPAAGVLRGTKTQVANVSDFPHVIDLSEYGVKQGNSRLNMFLPPQQVPKAFSSLIDSINKIDRNSSPEEIFAIYKTFIHIHPYLDGNSRTGRILLHHMIAKAEFPITIKSSESLYFNPGELAVRYFESTFGKEHNLREAGTSKALAESNRVGLFNRILSKLSIPSYCVKPH